MVFLFKLDIPTLMPAIGTWQWIGVKVLEKLLSAVKFVAGDVDVDMNKPEHLKSAKIGSKYVL